MVDSMNVEDCHCIKISNSYKKVKIKLWKRKDASKLQSSNEKLKKMDLSSPGFRDKVYINDNLCKYYKL